MKLKSYIYSIVAGSALLFTACSPDEYDLGKINYVPDQLVEGISFTVTPDSQDPNTIHLQSLVKGVTPLWVTPQGRSQKEKMSIELPFSGEYEVTFGVMTQGGPVYGNPYKFQVAQNNFNMLGDPIWANLAGGVGKSRKWIPMNDKYGIGRCSSPMMYMDPNNVNGAGSTDVIFGSANWTPNWDPGFQDWLIGKTDPYMDSYMTFGLDAVNGCTAEVFRNDANGGTMMNGKFRLNLSDPKRPTISFIDSYLLHNAGNDGACDSYTLDLKILECTPYLLQIATMRTTDPWWLVWNFISEEASNDPSIIPTEDPGLLNTEDVQLPKIEDLATKLFTTELSGVTFTGNEMRFLINDETPYDWMWWNGATAKWNALVEGQYGSTWAPIATSDLTGFELVLSEKDGAYNWSAGTQSGTCAINGSTIKFMDKEGAPYELSFLIAEGDERTVEVKGSEFTVLDIEPGGFVQMGVPASTDAKDNVNSYLCVNLNYKSIATGPQGPMVIPVDNSKVQVIFGDGKPGSLRIQLYNPWGGSDWPLDVSKLKLKKNQTLTLQYKVLGGITWNEGVAPKTVIQDNNIGNTWEPGCFDLPHAVPFDMTPGAVQTVSVTNTTSSTVTYEGSSCLCVGIQLEGNGVAATDADGNPDVPVEIVSLTIQ